MVTASWFTPVIYRGDSDLASGYLETKLSLACLRRQNPDLHTEYWAILKVD